jgi:2,5-dioxopentanoate dehydrogenase
MHLCVLHGWNWSTLNFSRRKRSFGVRLRQGQHRPPESAQQWQSSQSVDLTRSVIVELNGRSLIGFSRGQESGDKFYAVNTASGERLGPMFLGASAAEADHAAELAGVAFEQYSRLPGKRRAALLRTIAENIEALGEALVECATAETGLSADRIRSERDRTRNQLRLFADVVEEGSWVDARIDRADAARKPLPRPDVRSMLRPLGPVVVFGASNFPLAFSAAGGDTASALAAGNPVIVKAHAAHPGTADRADPKRG